VLVYHRHDSIKYQKVQEKYHHVKFVWQVYYDNSIGYYEGDFDDHNRICGKGTMTYKNGDRYEGEFLFAFRSGKGIMKYNNGDIYEGEWKNYLREGKGIMIYNDGSKYEGEWKKGELKKPNQ